MNRVDIGGCGWPFRNRRGLRITPGASGLLPVLCTLMLGACSSDRDPATGTKATAVSAIAPVDAGELTDPLIDPGDSYLVTTAVTRTTTMVESAEPFFDPATGQEVTTLTFPDVVDTTRVEAGYDFEGTVRVNELRTGSDSAGLAARVTIAGNTATFYDRIGSVVHDTSGPILMDALGPMDNVIVTSEAVFRDDAPVALAGIAGSSAPPSGGSRGDGNPSVERRGDRLVKTYSLDDPSSGVRGERVRQYRKSGKEWVVAEERIQTTHVSGGLSFEVLETTLYPTVRWKTNEDKDARRRQRRPSVARSEGAASAVIPGSSRAPLPDGVSVPTISQVTDVAVGSVASSCLLCADDGGSGDINPLFVDASPPTNVAYQHGGFADGSTWARMDPALSVRHNFRRRLTPSLDWRAGLESQATTLGSILAADGANRYLVIGHSNGGLIARRAGQYALGDGAPLIAGVVAIAAPHRGLPLAYNSRGVVVSLLTMSFRQVLANIGGSCGSRQFSWLCSDMNDVVLTFVPRVVNFAFDASMPMSKDARPGSAFLTALNGTSEPFLRYSVEVESQGAWKFVRMLGDWKCNPEDWCSGDHLQNAMESAYDVLRYCGSNEIAKMLNPSLAERCRNVRWSLNSANTLYERLIANGDNSDGLVPAKSQAYPGLGLQDRQFIKNAKESHVGELKSATTRNRVSFLVNRHTSQSL